MDLLGLSDLAKTLTAVATAVGVLFAFFRWFRPRWREARADIRAGRDALVGRPEIRDSITGAVIAPALPGIGVRMDTNEKQLATLTEAVVALANTTIRLDDHERRIIALEQGVKPTVVVQNHVQAPVEPLDGLGQE